MWTFLLGPVLSLLPQRLRKSLPFCRDVNWVPATTLSGLAEVALAIFATLLWYDYSMTTWVSRGVDSALAGKMGPGVNDQAIGFTAYVIWATHPLTWCLGYFSFEGTVRLCGAAFGDTILGTLPLFLLDKIFTKLFLPAAPNTSDSQFSERNLSSLIGAIWERILAARTPEVADELSATKNDTEEILEIRACRRKPDWTPPRVVRYDGNYYRLESCSRTGTPSRPFLYTLRRLPVGVPGRSVLLYSP
jgi:hypothetical protein